ncbi:hypothetical protein BJX65DRAFT_39861 [Aspergillus insuetus]
MAVVASALRMSFHHNERHFSHHLNNNRTHLPPKFCPSKSLSFTDYDDMVGDCCMLPHSCSPLSLLISFPYPLYFCSNFTLYFCFTFFLYLLPVLLFFAVTFHLFLPLIPSC